MEAPSLFIPLGSPHFSLVAAELFVKIDYYPKIGIGFQ